MEEKKPRKRIASPLISAMSFEPDDEYADAPSVSSDNTSDSATQKATDASKKTGHQASAVEEMQTAAHTYSVTNDDTDQYITEHDVTSASEAYGNSAQALNDSDNYIEATASSATAPRKNGLARLVHESFLLNFIRFLLLSLSHAVRTSKVINFFTRNDRFKGMCQESKTLDAFTSNRLMVKLLKLKHRLINQISNSRILSGRHEVGTNILRTPVRFFCVFLISLGLSAFLLFWVNIRFFRVLQMDLPVSQPYLGLLIAAIALAFMPFGGTLSEMIKSSAILKTILFRFFGASIRIDDESPIRVRYSVPAVYGILIAGISLVLPLYRILIALALIICCGIILKSPETGVLFIIVSVCFVPFNYVCMLILAVWISFAIKFFSGKRILCFAYVDIFPLLITVILLVAGIVSLGRFSYAAFLPAILSTLYFLFAGLIRDHVWAERCRTTFTVSGIIAAVTALIRILPGNPFSLSMNLFAVSDLGTRTDSVFSNSGVLAFILALLFFMQLSNFYTKNTTSEKLCQFLLCVLFATTLMFIMGARSLIVFTVLALFGIAVIAKGLRFILPLTLAACVIMPVFGLPSVTEIIASAYADVAQRTALWLDSFKMLTSYNNFTAILGTGIRPDAADMLYTGSLSNANVGSLAIWLILSIGIPMFVAVLLFTLFVIKYCTSHCRKCSDKNTPSRIYTLGGLLAIFFTLTLGITENVFFNHRCAAMFWLLLGFTVSVQRYSTGDLATDYTNDHILVPEI